ncbi:MULTISPECIES: fasciclin domain-containing protein [Streptomyces]|uniref:fasciclin domain-containing protein n=1 Tax=Streptomyces TaxID=1883 RepID=UPI002242D0C3|nr:fasciclin domain-containing protein [Streptomyces griseolus]MCW8217791.1 fasciclin domain-containing protein [Streptomyces griseolus]
MKITHHRTIAVAAAAALALPLSLGALVPQALADTSSPSPSTDKSSSPSASPGATKPFGPDCSAFSKSTRDAVAKEPLATAAARDPNLSTLVSAVKAAGLTDTLNKAKDTTLFAPTNAAFDKMGKAKVDALLKNKAELKKLLTYHVVGEKISPDQLPHGDFTTMEGGKLTTTGSGTSFKVNNTAAITCGDITTANGKVYVIDGVLTPPSS